VDRAEPGSVQYQMATSSSSNVVISSPLISKPLVTDHVNEYEVVHLPQHILSKSPSVASVNSTHSTVEELLLNELLIKYSKNLPLKVRVSKGFLGVSEETAINTDDILKLHFMKHSKVVVMETGERVNLSVPLSSYLKFSILYDPNNNLQEAMKGFKLVSLTPLVTPLVTVYMCMWCIGFLIYSEP
jgi:hypothetical protein